MIDQSERTVYDPAVTMRFGFTLVFSLLLTLLSGSLAQAGCADLRPTSQERSARISRLKKVIHEAILTETPHDQRGAGGGGVFTGNYDWHSAVHAHWALLSLARLTADERELSFVLNRLTPKALESEREYLANPANAAFEMPYGRSWLLLLLNELEKIPGRGDATVKRLREDTENQLIAWLENTPFPDGANPPLKPQIKEAGQKFRGDHFSWLFSYLLFSMSEPRRPEIRKRLALLMATKINPARREIGANPQLEWDFLHIPSVLALVDRIARTDGQVGAILVNDLQRLSPLRPKVDAATAHTPGAAMVAVWPHATESAKNDWACVVFQKRLNEIISQPEQWAGDFHFVSHWVPQFIWMGLWLEMGRP